MAEIHPNDIGLATFEDVGDVAKLRTAAKVVVDAINEIQENGSGSGLSFEQIYVDGKNNLIIGEDNVVYGSNNLIIGSNNVIVGSNLNVIATDSLKYVKRYVEFSYDSYDIEKNLLWYWYWGEEEFVPYFGVGDKLAVSLVQCWAKPDGSDSMIFHTEIMVGEIVEVNEESSYIKIDGLNISTIPPDDVYTVMDYCYPENVVILNDTCMLKGEEGSVILGGLATGMGSLSSGKAEAYGENSFAACYSHANGQYSSALGCGKATTYCSFAANIGESHGSCSAAVNTGLAFSPYSFSHGYKTVTLGRPLKALSLDIPSKSIVIDSAYSLSGVYSGNKIMIRCRNGLDPLIYNQAKVKSVSGNTIYYEEETYVGDGSSSAYRLFTDGYIFMIDNSITYATSSESGGYYTIASGKYTSSNGYYTIAMADGANIWGKYGINTEPYSIALANGNSFEHPSLAFKVLSTGSVHADAAYTTPCADYAEFFEWEDDNEDGEDRTGYFVKLVGEKITKCDEFDDPLGIVSATPAIVGDSGELHWKNKFATDDFGRIQYHDVLIPEEKDEEGNIIIEEHIETQPVLNPQWNADEVYIPRKERKEWSPVGVFGKLIVYDDGTLKPGDICRPGKGGIAVKSVKNGYQVLKRISDDKIMIWFRG